MTIEIDDSHFGAADAHSELVADATAGLSHRPKSLPPRWFYDARGSELFEQITELREYYPTRTERSILAAHAPEIAAAVPVETVIELGSGSSSKTQLLLDAWRDAGSLKRIVPLDVSAAALADAAPILSRRYPDADVHPVRADFTRHLGRLDLGGRGALVFLGSTIGNLRPAERARFLADARSALGPTGVLVLGTDLVKSPDVLVPAYDDAEGVTAEFNRNVLAVLNSELGGDLDLDAFDHIAVWNSAEEQIEMRLRASRELRATFRDLDFDVHFEPGEEMLTEISAKFRRAGVTAELAKAGFELTEWFTDPDDLFAVSVSR